MRGYGDTEPYRKALRKRQVWVEPLFAEAKDWHGQRRFRLRTLEKVSAEALLIAAGQNIKRLLTFGERGPRRLAQVAALRQPVPNPYKFRRARRHHKRCSGRPARVFQHAGVFSEVRSARLPKKAEGMRRASSRGYDDCVALCDRRGREGASLSLKGRGVH